MFFKRLAAVLLPLFLLLSCSRSTESAGAGVTRIAVLPFENLTTDAGLSWASAASSAVLAYDLTGPKNLHLVEAGSIREARLKSADRYVEGYFAVSRGSLDFHATIEDPTTLKTSRMIELKSPADNVIESMNQLARHLNPEARQFPACKTEAMRLYAQALQDASAVEAAVKADPGCTPLYLAWAESLARRGDNAGAAKVCATALGMPGVDAIGRAQLEFVGATARQDATARLQALHTLTSLLPADVELLKNTAASELSSRNFTAAVRSLEAAAQADPNDSQTWNTLGYARAGAHDLKGAQDALEHYQKLLPPGETNGLDSLGEVSFFLGDFAAAEKYFLEAQQRNPQEFGGRELLKAAEARMMTGDLAGADAIFGRVQNWGTLDRAQWEFITGRHKQAIERLANPKNAREALQLTIWKAQTKQGPVPQNSNEALGRAVSFLLSGNFAQAAPILEQLYRATNPGGDGQIRTLLAWAYAQTGRRDEAAKLVDLYPIPLGTDGEPILASLVFPRVAQLRGELLNSAKDRQLAAKYAGD